MPECDCRRPTTPEGIFHESTCATRLTERDRDYKRERDDALARIAAFLPIGGSALAALDAAHADLRHPFDPPGREYASDAGRAADLLRAGLLALDGVHVSTAVGGLLDGPLHDLDGEVKPSPTLETTPETKP